MKCGFLVFPGLEELDLIGPWEMFSLWAKLRGEPDLCRTVAQTREPVVCAKGLTLVPQTDFGACPQLDYLIVPGGEGTRQQVDNEALIRFVATQAQGAQAVLSVCTGSFLLQRAGLLAGRRATTHWSALARLAAPGEVQVVPERVVRDGNIWTAAGVSAGIDLALAFIAAVDGEEVAGKIQLGAEYYPTGQIFGSAHLAPHAPAYLRKPPPGAVPGRGGLWANAGSPLGPWRPVRLPLVAGGPEAAPPEGDPPWSVGITSAA